jgi:hypothetical protein
VRIDSAQLSTISVSIAGGLTIPHGSRSQATAKGTYADGTTWDLTEAVIWLSMNEPVAVVSNASDTQGLVTALAAGSAELWASWQSVVGKVQLTVQ